MSTQWQSVATAIEYAPQDLRDEARIALHALCRAPEAAPVDGMRDAWLDAFVQGAKFWEWHKTGATMWPSDQSLAYNKAQAKYAAIATAPTREAAPVDGMVLIRREAIDWLNGESDFKCPPDRYFRGEAPAYWWRSVFREKAGLAAPTREAAPFAQGEQGDSHAFKNFHRMLCERFDYCHDEKDWWRDQVSLMEHIAKLTRQPASPAEPVAADAHALRMRAIKLVAQLGNWDGKTYSPELSDVLKKLSALTAAKAAQPESGDKP
jgi:hypothetical protein